MITYISRMLSNKIVGLKFVEESEKEVYSYGIEIIVSSTVSISVVILFSFFLGKIPEAILYLLTYCSIRRNAGGYHANSHGKCIFMFAILYLISYFIMQFIEFSLIQTIIILLMV